MKLIQSWIHLLLVAVSVPIHALKLSIYLPPSPLLPNPHDLPASTHAILTVPSLQSVVVAPLSPAASFEFDIPSNEQEESYMILGYSHDFVFVPLRVDVARNGSVTGMWESYMGQSWEEKGAPRLTSEGKGEIRVVKRRGFYQERPRFSPLTLLRNPMLLLGILAMLLTFGFPKLMDLMDPEMKAEFERARTETGRNRGPATQTATSATSFDFAGWMAGTSPGPMAVLDSAGQGQSMHGRAGWRRAEDEVI